MKNSSSPLIETLRLCDRDKAKLLWAIEQANKEDGEKNPRRLRVPARHTEAVLKLIVESGSNAQMSVLTRNLSRWGAALVHGRYVHPNTRCELYIQARDGAWHSQGGMVRHSRHIQGMIHEIGVEFSDPIELNRFARLTTKQESRYAHELADDTPDDETSGVVQLSHKVLIVDDFTSDRKLFDHWLSSAGLTVRTAVDARAALIRIQEQAFDLLVVDCRVGQGNGMETIKALRDNRYTGPIIAVSADDSAPLKEEALATGASRFLAKPFTEEELASTAYELMGIDVSADLSPIYSTLRDDDEIRPLLCEFTRGLQACIDDLRDAHAQNDFETVSHISHRLKGAGSGYGFPDITDRAGEVLLALGQDATELEKIKQTTTDLVATLSRVKLG